MLYFYIAIIFALLYLFSSFLPRIYFAFSPLIFCPKFWILYLEKQKTKQNKIYIYIHTYIYLPMENKEAAWKKWLFFWRPDPSFSFFLLPVSITTSVDSVDFLYEIKLNHNRQLGCTLRHLKVNGNVSVPSHTSKAAGTSLWQLFCDTDCQMIWVLRNCIKRCVKR